MPKGSKNQKRPADVIGNISICGCVLAIVLLFSFPCAAGPADVSVQTLLANCSAAKSTAQWGYCVGYIAGVADQMSSFGLQRTEYGDRTRPRPHESICPDGDNVDVAVTVPLFVNWAEHNPEKSQFPASLGVGFALQEKWPCKF
jgi:hypothetical protein